MGQDKAFLPSGKTGEALWKCQLHKLEALQPAELLVSANPDQVFDTALRILVDPEPDRGPLLALHAALEASSAPLLLILAVDMPGVTVKFLREMQAHADPARGLVYRRDNFFEPFPAIYPVAAASLARECLDAGRDSLQAFITEGLDRGVLHSLPLPDDQSDLFKNLNTPEDLE